MCDCQQKWQFSKGQEISCCILFLALRYLMLFVHKKWFALLFIPYIPKTRFHSFIIIWTSFFLFKTRTICMSFFDGFNDSDVPRIFRSARLQYFYYKNRLKFKLTSIIEVLYSKNSKCWKSFMRNFSNVQSKRRVFNRKDNDQLACDEFPRGFSLVFIRAHKCA